MRLERTSSIPRILRTASMSRRSVQLSEEARAQLAAMKRTVRRGTNWSALFRRLKPSQQQSSIAKSFQMRAHNTTDLMVAGIEVLIALASALQLGLTYKTPFWVRRSAERLRANHKLLQSNSALHHLQRQNRACADREDCTIDLSDGSFGLPNGV